MHSGTEGGEQRGAAQRAGQIGDQQRLGQMHGGELTICVTRTPESRTAQPNRGTADPMAVWTP